jgi:hypothetical protein
MATRNRRNEWHQVHGRWTRSLGERGMRVRIFEKRRNGTFYRTTWVPGRGRDHASLGTRDRNEAERLGRMLLAELLRQEGTTRSERLTLGALWKRYETECATYLDNKASTRRDDAARVKLLLAFFGEHCDVRTLTARDQSAYAASRKAGGVVTGYVAALLLLGRPSPPDLHQLCEHFVGNEGLFVVNRGIMPVGQH